MKLRFSLVWVLLLGLVGCGKKTDTRQLPAPPQPGVTQQAQQQAGAPDLTPTLANLTQALRKYSIENRRVPANLNELVTAGYIASLPSPPPGKKFAINPKRMEVVLVNE